MYIVAIAWIYVAGMIAITEPTVVSGLFSFFIYGLFPMSLVFWLGNSKARRQRRAQAENEPETSVADQGADERN